MAWLEVQGISFTGATAAWRPVTLAGFLALLVACKLCMKLTSVVGF